MKKNVVIAGSASLIDKVTYWKSFWENQGYIVLDDPAPIPAASFMEMYPQVHTDFFRNIEATDTFFLMNEDKNGIPGYIGPESFAEMAYAVAQNLVHQKNIEVLILQMPDPQVKSYEEIELWLKLGWIKMYSQQ